MAIADVLTDHPLFVGFSAEDLGRLCDAGEVKSFEVGETIIRAGRPGTHLGIVLEGRVEVVGQDERGRPRRYAELGALDYFGEISLISGEPTTADVRAVIPSRVLLIPHEVFAEALSSRPQALQQLARTVSQRLRAQLSARVAPEAAPSTDAGPGSAGTSTADIRVLVLDCAAERLAYAYFDIEHEFHNREGSVEGLTGERPEHVQATLRGRTVRSADAGLPAAIECVLRSLAEDDGPLDGLGRLTAIAHRVVRGGEQHGQPASIDDALVQGLRELPAAPPELQPNLEGIDVCGRLAPGVPQVAVFDTAFFQNLPPAAFLYPLPYGLYRSAGLRRSGAHGLVHHQAALLAADHLESRLEALRLITCRLDHTPSLCAIDGGRAIDVSSGLSTAGALPGASSAGELEPDVFLAVARHQGLSLEETVGFLNHSSGLQALSGVSGGPSELAAAAQRGDERAALALDVWAHAIRKCIGGYVAALGGLDALVFTGACGEAESVLRTRICQGLEGLGLELDPRLGASPEAAGAADIASPRSSARILLIGTDEPRMAAAEALAFTGHPALASLFRRRRHPIPIAISAHHVHLSQEHVEALFGPGHTLTFRAELSQPGQFACEEAVALVGPKGRVERVRVLGPKRPATQVEISRTEEFQLGIDAPIRASGDVAGSPGLRIEGPAGAVELQEGVICAARHVHMSPEDALRFRVRDKDHITVRVEGARPISFGDVLVRVHPDFRLDMHVDTDEGNAAELDRDAVGYIEAIGR